MISMPDIIKKAQNAGWTYTKYVDLMKKRWKVQNGIIKLNDELLNFIGGVIGKHKVVKLKLMILFLMLIWKS
jgi:hypothetical protein